MVTDYNLDRFLAAQEKIYLTALSEIKAGRKQSHSMWYVFPQIKGLGFSDTSKYYAISGRSEAIQYLAHPFLGKRFIEISEALLNFNGKSAWEIFRSPDDLKLQSCMTLFSSLVNDDPVFQAVLDKYFRGHKDDNTLLLVTKMSV